MKFKNKQVFDEWKEKQKGHDDPMADAYGLACFSYAERWADLMEAHLEANPDAKFEEFANKLSHEADEEGITGFMYGCAVSILAQCWEHGVELRRWHNKEWGVPDDKLDDGVANPAVFTIGKKEDQ